MYAQKNIDSSGVDTTGYVQYYIIDGDTIPHEAIDLDEVIILGKLKFKDNLARRKYLILRRKTRKVYPYAKLASDRLTTLNERLEGITSKRSKKKYIKILQKYMEEEFTKELKKLTRTEGQILVKLIHRQTGKTMFKLVKEYRSGWRAFWYNNTAKLFKISLKKEYDPINIEEDYWIEDILQRSFQSSILKDQKTALDFSFYDAINKWSTTTNLNHIKK
nr:DUF4294 domain-containing protein [Aquimarina longa]